MSKYIQERAFKAFIPVTAIHRVLASCIEHGLAEFTVADDRGGSDHWVIMFTPDTSRQTIRDVVGARIQVEPA